MNVAMTFLDDPVTLESVFIAEGQTTVEATTHDTDDPHCYPSLKTHKTFLLHGDKLIVD
jgi:hypothetical protein